MKNFRILIIAFLSLVLPPSAIAQSRGGVPLTSLPRVSGSTLETHSDSFSIGGHAFQSGYYPFGGMSDRGAVICALKGKYSQLELWIGFPDGRQQFNDEWRDRQFSVSLDGEIAKSGTISPGDSPVHLILDVSKAQSLKIDVQTPLEVGDPTLYKATPMSANVATLVAPSDRTQVTGSSVNHLWEPVNGAASYGVEIVCTKGSSPRIYALNVTGGDSNAKFDLSDVPNGEYHWSVIAFNDKGVMGKFSKDRTFVVAK